MFSPLFSFNTLFCYYNFLATYLDTTMKTLHRNRISFGWSKLVALTLNLLCIQIPLSLLTRKTLLTRMCRVLMILISLRTTKKQIRLRSMIPGLKWIRQKVTIPKLTLSRKLSSQQTNFQSHMPQLKTQMVVKKLKTQSRPSLELKGEPASFIAILLRQTPRWKLSMWQRWVFRLTQSQTDDLQLFLKSPRSVEGNCGWGKKRR